MPGLIAFRRRWGTGSDDLVIPGFLLFCLHIILFLVIAILISTSSELDDLTSYDLNYLENAQPKNYSLISKVKCATEIRNYSLGYLVLIAVASVAEMVLTCFSMKGTILDPEPRRPVEYIFYIRIGFGAIEMGFSVAVSVMVAKRWNSCDVVEQLNNMLIGIIAINVFVFVIVLLVGCCVFDPAGSKYYKAKAAVDRLGTSWSTVDQMRREFYEKSRKTWFNRVNNCFCCVSNKQSNMKQGTLDEVSSLLHNFFKDYDFVPSDIVAGLTLLRYKQQCIEATTAESKSDIAFVSNEEDRSSLLEDNNVEKFICGRPITPNTRFINFSDQKTRQNCEELSYYCAYSLAAYGPLFYWMQNSATGLCQILKECMCVKNPTFTSPCCMRHRISRNRKVIVRSDEGCGWTHAGIRKSLIEHGVVADIVYVSLANEIYQQPFYLSVDHQRKTVVVAIRGTLGEEDALTDMVANAKLIASTENDGTWKAHKGMLRGAEFIKNKLLHEDMVLSLGFGHCIARGTRNYNLVILGHSLGAGVASILAILLHPLYPNLRCYAYSPPGGLLSRSAMIASKDYIHTLILGKDVIPRMGIPQLENLRNEVVELLKHTNLPKYKIILSNVCGSLNKDHKYFRHENLSDRAVRNSLIREPSDSDAPSVTLHEPLYLPGLVHHLIYTKELMPGCRSSEQKKYYIVYGNNVSDFQQIVVSHQMISHHFPQEVWKCMKEALENYPKDRCFNTYTVAETLPYNEKSSNVPAGTNIYKATSLNEHDTLPNMVESTRNDSLSESSISMRPISLNNDQMGNATAEVNVADVSSSSSSEFSLSSIPDATAPLARPESFTLSSSARSPTSPFAADILVQRRRPDVMPNMHGSTSTDRLLNVEQKESASHISTSTTSTLQSNMSHPFDKCGTEQYDSNLSCDDLNVDIHGTYAES